MFEFVDAIEVHNGKLSADENDMARKVAEKLGLPGTAGSDAHRLDELGTAVTIFENDITDEIQLVEALRVHAEDGFEAEGRGLRRVRRWEGWEVRGNDFIQLKSRNGIFSFNHFIL